MKRAPGNARRGTRRAPSAVGHNWRCRPLPWLTADADEESGHPVLPAPGNTDCQVLTLTRRITTCIIIHAPNQGSMVANVAIALDSAAVVWRRIWPDPQIETLLAKVHEEAGALAYQDFAVGSPTLASIAAAEPVGHIAYYTFGGTKPVMFRVGGWAFTPESAIWQVHDPPFHWMTAYQALFAVPDFIPGLPEGTPGAGDLLVAAARSSLPFSRHRENPLNHADCLWDPAIQSQVDAILRAVAQPVELHESFAVPRPAVEPSPVGVQAAAARRCDVRVQPLKRFDRCPVLSPAAVVGRAPAMVG